MYNVLTTSNCTPIDNDQTSITAGVNGPVLIQDFNLIDKLAHFDRERIPERVVHAKDAGPHDEFVVTHDVTHLTKAMFLSEVGKRTPMFVRYSIVGGERGSAYTTRDPRGFSIKFYTEEGNYDIVGNNTLVFFIRDPSNFLDFINTQKRNPRTNTHDKKSVWDFFSLVPESINQVTILYSNHGTPDGFRHMHDFGSHTFKMVGKEGKFKYIKRHFKTCQGVKNLKADKAAELVSSDLDYAIQDMFDAIERDDYPSWDVYVQVMEPEDAKKYRWNIFDVTKDYPLQRVGKYTLNRNPENYFAEVEQAAFSPSHLVPGINVSADRMLQGRLFSYPDTQRYRLGMNYKQIPINRPLNIANYQRDGIMCITNNGGDSVSYGPKSFGGPEQNNLVGTTFSAEEVEGLTGRFTYELTDDDFVQAGNLYRLMDEENKIDLINNIADDMKTVKNDIVKRQIEHSKHAEPDYGSRIEKVLADLQK